ncbi:Flagellum-specific ATP synthase [Rhodobacteraceae bacterium THAF1]|uniref:FliI/YscN family ATPase n=1 Tax=Palleronia sp. THAF1 TaxID=2587842 RepID=UPI000F3BD7E6|nr:FliI/YscN family ATPase [Palleronia sp. THAF1]QFU10292.1 Flagellum-specific ATP synthase [Palleronia sp. THAF1]VDC16803.1 Flagellum-specific ATP synthase [Rhodobacteraceae bacterium THAF1]
MTPAGYDNIRAALNGVTIERPLGQVCGILEGTIEVSGLNRLVAIGDRVRIGATGRELMGEIVGAEGTKMRVLPDGSAGGLRIGDDVAVMGVTTVSPDDSWIGRIVDPAGRPLDGRPLLPGPTNRSLAARAPAAADRRTMGARIETGLRAFNTLLPIVRGQRIGLFAGSGVGKSSLLAALARRLDADVVVFAMIGERSREIRDAVERGLGPDGMARTVIIAATADAPATERARCLPAALSVAEHHRDAGKHVLLLADSITRHAEAHRQVAGARGETPVFGGYPASMPTDIAALCERAGPGAEGQGDITAVFTVLVAGGDHDGPVADTLRGILDGHIVLDRRIAERGRFPAVDLSRSVSRSLPEAASDHENTLIAETRRLIGAYERSEMMIKAGLYAAGSDRTLDAAIESWARIDTFLSQSEAGTMQDSFVALARCLSRRGQGGGE